MESNIISGGLQPILSQPDIYNETHQTSEMRFENIGYAASLTCLTAIGVNLNLFMVGFILLFWYSCSIDCYRKHLCYRFTS